MIFDQKEMMKFNFTNFTKIETFSSNWVAYENFMILKIIFTWQDYKFACVYPFSMSFFDRTSFDLNFYYLLIPVFCILKQYIRTFIYIPFCFTGIYFFDFNSIGQFNDIFQVEYRIILLLLFIQNFKKNHENSTNKTNWSTNNFF